MPRSPRARRRAPAVILRRWLALLVALSVIAVPVVLLGGSRSQGGPPPREPAAPEPNTVDLRLLGRPTGRLDLAQLSPGGKLDRLAVRRTIARLLPTRRIMRRGTARIVHMVDRAATARRVAAVAPRGGRIEVPTVTESASVTAPVVAQALRNNCESAALEILLTTMRRRVDQLRLQRELPTSGVLDPVDTSSGRVWGDPERGYVGRADGGGVAGGFGVYPGPVRAVARRHGARLDDLTGRSPAAIYRRLLAGRAVMVWIGLSEGPYGEWRSPSGRRVRVNFGEHTVVLHGRRRDGSLLVSNPLEGTREVWRPEMFETLWLRLGRRALAAPL